MIDNTGPDVMKPLFADDCKLAVHIFADLGTCRQARSAAKEFLFFALATRQNAARADCIVRSFAQIACAVVLQEAHRATITNGTA